MHRRAGAPRFIDKMPNNFPHIGLLSLILPNARIIDARRHPLDACLSCYRQLFAKGQAFTYDLTEIGEYYLQYQRMMDHWAAVLPGRVLTVQYEEVVDGFRDAGAPAARVLRTGLGRRRACSSTRAIGPCARRARSRCASRSTIAQSGIGATTRRTSMSS